jgi:oligoribonuclease NrnB/cAMP/cGMP phosphodiesterase (DHH superfamily)
MNDIKDQVDDARLKMQTPQAGMSRELREQVTQLDMWLFTYYNRSPKTAAGRAKKVERTMRMAEISRQLEK